MTNDEIKAASGRYCAQQLAVAMILNAAYHVAKAFGVLSLELLNPVTISAIFMILTSVVIGLVWRKVAISAPDSLPTFFMAVSGFRMLLALFTLLGCYIAVGRSNMAPYIIVFMIFYFLALIHHSIFFARINNKK